MEVDLDGAFLEVPYGVMHEEDIRTYIHVALDENNDSKLREFNMNHLCGGDCILKEEYKALEKKKFMQYIEFPSFAENSWV